MYVYVCFDVEDLVHPDADDVALDIASALAAEGIVASMCVVGEKARLWERRGRNDVIAAVRRHDVSLHTNRHSMHPTPSEYLADKGWADGVAEAVRREGPGAEDIARIFGRPPSTWGTPGSGWGPQIPAATRRLGIRSNIYSHAHSGTTGACRFAGQLCFPNYLAFPGDEDNYADDSAFEAALRELLDGVAEASRRGCACLGFFAAHPTRLRYTVFWDALNYAHGQNTEPERYRFAPRRSDEEYATSLRNLQRAIRAVRDLPEVDLIPVRELVERFPADEGGLASSQLHWLAQTIAESGEIPADNPLATPAQMLDALGHAILALANGDSLPAEIELRPVLGPMEQPPALEKPVTLYGEMGLAPLQALLWQIAATGHLPASTAVGGAQVGPGPVLRTLASAFLALERGQEPNQVMLTPGAEEPAVAAALAEEGIYRCVPTWVPHRRDMSLDRLALHTRLQSWSLKPALLKG